MQIVRRHPPAIVSHASKHSTWQKQGSKHPTVVHSSPGPYSTSRLPVNSTRQKQHSTQQPAYMQPFQQPPGTIHLILQGIHLVSTKFTKGSSITLHCNTTSAVCSNLLLLVLKIILQENTRKLLLSRYLVILCEEITYYPTSKQS